jgi:adenylylsulfate kinase-like enzyme
MEEAPISAASSRKVFQKDGNLVVGITGHTGCGKSFVSRLMQKMIQDEGIECTILDADVIAKNIRDNSK